MEKGYHLQKAIRLLFHPYKERQRNRKEDTAERMPGEHLLAHPLPKRRFQEIFKSDQIFCIKGDMSGVYQW
jgi:hypothetical protein